MDDRNTRRRPVLAAAVLLALAGTAAGQNTTDTRSDQDRTRDRQADRGRAQGNTHNDQWVWQDGRWVRRDQANRGQGTPSRETQQRQEARDGGLRDDRSRMDDRGVRADREPDRDLGDARGQRDNRGRFGADDWQDSGFNRANADNRGRFGQRPWEGRDRLADSEPEWRWENGQWVRNQTAGRSGNTNQPQGQGFGRGGRPGENQGQNQPGMRDRFDDRDRALGRGVPDADQWRWENGQWVRNQTESAGDRFDQRERDRFGASQDRFGTSDRFQNQQNQPGADRHPPGADQWRWENDRWVRTGPNSAGERFDQNRVDADWDDNRSRTNRFDQDRLDGNRFDQNRFDGNNFDDRNRATRIDARSEPDNAQWRWENGRWVRTDSGATGNRFDQNRMGDNRFDSNRFDQNRFGDNDFDDRNRDARIDTRDGQDTTQWRWENGQWVRAEARTDVDVRVERDRLDTRDPFADRDLNAARADQDQVQWRWENGRWVRAEARGDNQIGARLDARWADRPFDDRFGDQRTDQPESRFEDRAERFTERTQAERRLEDDRWVRDSADRLSGADPDRLDVDVRIDDRVTTRVEGDLPEQAGDPTRRFIDRGRWSTGTWDDRMLEEDRMEAARFRSGISQPIGGERDEWVFVSGRWIRASELPRGELLDGTRLTGPEVEMSQSVDVDRFPRGEDRFEGRVQGRNDAFLTRERLATARDRFAGAGLAAMQDVSGRIERLNTLRLAENDRRHLIARVDTREGYSARVDLGPEDQLRDLDLDQGDVIEVSGMPGRINDRPVIMAERVEAKGRTVTVHRAPDPALMRIEGTLLETRSVRPTGLQQDHLLAKVRADNGQTHVVDLGPRPALERARLRDGAGVKLLATRVMINEHTALAAEQLRVDNGELLDIERPQQLARQNTMSTDQRLDDWFSNER